MALLHVIQPGNDRKVLRLSHDIARALGDFDGGYCVQLHGMPGWSFKCDAGSVDDAHRMALSVADQSGKCATQRGATISAL